MLREIEIGIPVSGERVNFTGGRLREQNAAQPRLGSRSEWRWVWKNTDTSTAVRAEIEVDFEKL